MKDVIVLISISGAIIVIFSLLTLGELWAIKRMGFDVIAHLKASHEKGPGSSFYFEAFGVVAFVVGQPIVLTILLIALIKNVMPEVIDTALGAAGLMIAAG